MPTKWLTAETFDYTFSHHRLQPLAILVCSFLSQLIYRLFGSL